MLMSIAAGWQLPRFPVLLWCGLHPGDLQAAIARPLVAMLLQGRKSVTTGLASFDYGPGEAMVIAADVPTTSQITEASQRFPYYALVLELDLAILRELQEAGPSGPDEAPRVGIGTDERPM